MVYKQKWQISSSPKGGHYLLLLMRRSIHLFTTTLCVLSWNMFEWGMMNGFQYKIDVLKCSKDKQCGACWHIWIFNLGLCSCGITIHHMSPGSHWLWKLDYWYRNNNVHDFKPKYRPVVKEKCIYDSSVKVFITQQLVCWMCEEKSVTAAIKHVSMKSSLHVAHISLGEQTG